MGIVLSLGWSFSIDYNSGMRRQVMRGIKLLWNVISSQWTGLHKLGCNGLSWHSIKTAPL